MNLAAVAATRLSSFRAPGKRRMGTMLVMRIERWDVRRDGPLSETALEHKVRALGFDPMLRSYPAKAISAAHTNTCERIEAVVSGLIKVTIGGESAILTAGDIVFVPAGAARRLEVLGDSSAHCLDAVLRNGHS